MDDTQQSHKSHRDKHSGRKAERKKAKSKSQDENLSAKQRNPKAFTFHSVDKAEKRFRRTMDIKAKKHHIPLVDRNPLEPPPIVVAIVGPPKVGKSTLMHCLIKNFTRQTLSSIQGPVTIVSGKKRRLTFIECNNDINNMIDIAKVADLVLLLIDASFGFEMETFEFLNICQVHGFPRIMGVLTHLDIFKNNKTLRTTKKQLKRRFWTEIYQGAKLFYLSGMVHGDYQKTEIHNLGRFISVMKFRPLSWKQNHPYILSDRMEDLTDPELIRQNPVCDRDICLYGYTRGGHFKNKTSVHIPGCGDFQIHDISFLPDPCPLPDKEKRRSLNEKEKLIYAPMSGVGGIVYDKDAVYIDLGGSHSHSDSKQEEKEESSEGIVGSLIDTQVAIDEKMAVSEMKLFQDSNPLKAEDVEGNSIFQTQTEERILDSGRVRRKAIFLDNEEDEMEVETSGSDDGDDSDEEIIDDNEDLDIVSDEINKRGNDREENIAFADSDDELEVTENARGVSHKTEKKHVRFSDDDPKIDTAEDSALRWKENLKEKAIMSFYQRQADTKNLNKLVYGAHHENHINDDDKSDGTDEIGGLFVISKDKLKSGKTLMNDVDCTQYKTDAIQDWRSSAVMDSIRDCFVTGKWTKSEDAETLIQQDDELFGDFEDLESGPASENNVRDSDHESCDENEKIEAEKPKEKTKREMTVFEKRLAKKKKMKELFDAEYDDTDGGNYYDDLKSELNNQSNLNKTEFESLDEELRVQYEGFRSGMYVRVEVRGMPCEFVDNFDPNYPVVVGGLLSGEENIGYVTVRIKKHRWFSRILKTRDPLILSLGWRRFQTIPLYTMQDHNGRNRLLKYTPQHLHCNANIWGPITPQNTGFLAVQSVSDQSRGFRISATGTVTDLDKSTEVVKKLKLTGTPLKIFRKTCFIKGMFGSALEATKFEGACIRTVSNIRGQIKKAIRSPPGAFRATFEDKILMSDIVFVRTWFAVQVPKFYNPVTTLLLPADQKSKWSGMKTVGQLRRERGIKPPTNPDSLYQNIERGKRVFHPLKIPKELQKQLPYAVKPKLGPKTTTPTVESKRVVVIREPGEQKISKLMQSIRRMHSQKVRKERISMKQRIKQHRKDVKRIDARRNVKHRQLKKEIYRTIGKGENKKRKRQD